jgi:hypothetical protein
MAVNGGFAGLYVTGGARLHLDEAENVVFPADQVDFSMAARRAEVARDHGVTQPPQMKVGGLFAAASGAVVWGGFGWREGAGGQPVEEAEDGAGGLAGKYGSGKQRNLTPWW